MTTKLDEKSTTEFLRCRESFDRELSRALAYVCGVRDYGGLKIGEWLNRSLRDMENAVSEMEEAIIPYEDCEDDA